MSEQKVSKGRMVRYLPNGAQEDVAAIVTAVNPPPLVIGDGSEGLGWETVDLILFPPAGAQPYPVTGVAQALQDADPQPGDTWKWPPR